ncbi:MAG: leucine-rich repeat domain-containing protein, partial [Clostridiales bacterium]|nr:leucine-rich repeat domain-containing protein [Clostridiales bacterium]
NALYYCESLRSITVSPYNSIYSSVSGVLYNKEKTKLILYPSCKTDSQFTIPDGVVSIGGFAFLRCMFLNKVVIPRGVTIVEEVAFVECVNAAIHAQAEGKPSGWHDRWYSEIGSLRWNA